ncbi:MAG: hypothetical protein ACFFCM_04255 [Promethearchaeota archaeon]
MANNEEEIKNEVWKKYLRKHWKMTLLIIAGIGIAFVCALLLFLWFILPNALSTRLVPRNLSLWTVGSVISFILNVILWEFLFIGIPVIVSAALIFALWWRKLPDDEKEEYTGEPKEKGKRRRMSSGGGGFFGFVIFITWLIIIYTDNQWNTPFIAWSIEYLVFSSITALLWDLLIFGVPIGIGGLLWILHEMKES